MTDNKQVEESNADNDIQWKSLDPPHSMMFQSYIKTRVIPINAYHFVIATTAYDLWGNGNKNKIMPGIYIYSVHTNKYTLSIGVRCYMEFICSQF